MHKKAMYFTVVEEVKDLPRGVGMKRKSFLQLKE